MKTKLALPLDLFTVSISACCLVLGAKAQDYETGNLLVATNLTVWGQVGIGTNAPIEDLHVVGNVLAEGRFIGSGAGLSNVAAASLLGGISANQVIGGRLSSSILPVNSVWDATGMVLSNVTIKGSGASFSNLTVQGPVTLFSNLTVSGGVIVGDQATYYSEFTPTNGIGWYRICRWYNYASGNVRICAWFNNAQTELEFHYSIAGRSDIQVVRRINYNCGPISKLRISGDTNAAMSLDIYVRWDNPGSDGGSPRPVKLYGTGPVMGGFLANPEFNPDPGPSKLSTVDLFTPENGRGGFLTSGLVSQQTDPYAAYLASDTNASQVKLGLVSDSGAGLALSYSGTSNILNTRGLNLDILSSSSTTPALRVQANNNYVGIGTATPGQRLHVAGSIKADGQIIGDGSGLTNVLATNLTGRMASSALPTNGFWDGVGMVLSNVIVKGNGGGLTNLQGSAISAGTLGTNQALASEWNTWGDNRFLNQTGDTVQGLFSVNSNLIVQGLVGIGTAQPGACINTDQGWQLYGPTDRMLAIQSQSTNGAVLDLQSTVTTGTNAIGLPIGTLAFTMAAGQPDAHRQVAAIKAIATTNGIVDKNNGADLAFCVKAQCGPYEAMRISSALGGCTNYPRVGIGTNSPAQALHVAGCIKAEGQFIGNGSGLYVLQQGDLSMGTFTNGLPQ